MTEIIKQRHELIHWLENVQDVDTIHALMLLKRSWETSSQLSDQEKEAIDAGLTDLREGRLKSHGQVMDSAKVRFPGLF
jgi:predicted transcriptional regulator